MTPYNWKIKHFVIRIAILFLEKFFSGFFSISIQFKKIDRSVLHKYYSQYIDVNHKYGIVMQGPIIRYNQFTYNTLKLYRYIYPNAQIVLSTWINQDQKIVNKIKELGVELLELVPPENKGTLNVNLQIISTSEGIKYLRSRGVQFVLKVRSDQRCNKNLDFLSYLRNIQLLFPVSQKGIKDRLVVISMNSFKTRFYGISDMFMFGHIDDMEKYWCVTPEDFCKNELKYTSPEIFIKNNVGEGYFVNKFFEYLQFNPEWTIEDSEAFITSYFCVVDKEQLDYFWLKYDRYFDSVWFNKPIDYKNWERYEFSDWLNYNFIKKSNLNQH